MDANEIEISLSVKVEAGIYFTIDSAEWDAMDEATKRKTIGAKIDSVAIAFGNDTHQFGEARMSGEIVGPSDDEIDLSQVDTYQPD